MTAVEFKIIDAADQQFSAVLGRKRTTIRIRYNPSNNRWSLNVSIDDKPVLHGRKIVTGINLMAPFDFDVGLIFAGPEREDFYPEPGRTELIGGIVKLCHMTEEDQASIVEEIEAEAARV